MQFYTWCLAPHTLALFCLVARGMFPNIAKQFWSLISCFLTTIQLTPCFAFSGSMLYVITRMLWHTGCIHIIITCQVEAYALTHFQNPELQLLLYIHVQYTTPPTPNFYVTYCISPTQPAHTRTHAHTHTHTHTHIHTRAHALTGLRGTYQGLTPTILKQGSNQAIRFSVYTSLKKYFQDGDNTVDIGNLRTFCIGGIAGAASVFGNTPIDVVKTRMQVCVCVCARCGGLLLLFGLIKTPS